MLNEDKLKELVAQHVDLIKYSSEGLTDALPRATQFLVIMAILTDEKRATDEEQARLKSGMEASFSMAVQTSGGRNITEKKVDAESNETYVLMREAHEEGAAKISWLRTYISIFENAHLLYRQMARE